MTTEATLDTVATPVPAGGAQVSTPSAAQGAATLYAEAPAPVTESTPAASPKVDTSAAEPAPASLATGAEPKVEAAPAETPAPEAEVVLTPESYEVKLPEGIVLDDSLMSEFKSLAAESKLDPKSAQPLMDLYIKAMNAQAAQVAATQQEWLAASNALPEFQGEMRKTSLATIGRAFDEYGTAEVQQVFAASGVGNHPAVVRMFLKMASALNEGGPVLPGTPVAQGRNGRPAAGATPGQIMYGDSPKSN